jgi:hypothetical protein
VPGPGFPLTRSASQKEQPLRRQISTPSVDRFHPHGRLDRFFPAIASGMPVLEFVCPACQVGDVDLRTCGDDVEELRTKAERKLRLAAAVTDDAAAANLRKLAADFLGGPEPWNES